MMVEHEIYHTMGTAIPQICKAQIMLKQNRDTT